MRGPGPGVHAGRWVVRPLASRLSAASAVPPPFCLPILCGLAVFSAAFGADHLRAPCAVLAVLFALPWLLAATSWVRVGSGGLLWRHLGRVRLVRWSSMTGCATVWAPQGRKQVRVVAVECGRANLVLLWPTAWIGERHRRALVEAVRRRMPSPVPSSQ